MKMSFETADVKNRERITFKDFRGVDTANPVYSVDRTRATAMRNFININGCNHKRPGWKQIARFKDSVGRSLRINGVFDFVMNKQSHRLVYAGTHFFIYDAESDTYRDFLQLLKENGQNCPNPVDESLLIDAPCQLFIYDDKAYIIGCGDYLILAYYDGELEMRRVCGDENTYIPRTTTNIAPNEIDKDENGIVIEYASRKTDRDVNILSKYRKNELIGSDYASEESPRTYFLDATEIDSIGFSMTIADYNDETGEVEEHIINVGGVDESHTGESETRRNIVAGDNLAGKTLYFDNSPTSIGTLTAEFSDTVLLQTDDVLIFARPQDETLNAVDIYASYNETETLLAKATRKSSIFRYTLNWEQTSYEIPAEATATVRQIFKMGAGWLNVTADLPVLERILYEEIKTTQSTEDEDEIVVTTQELWGYIDFSAGKITFIKPAHSIAGEPNIFVQFAKTVSDALDTVPHCGFGALFGVHGNANTLFLSGNEDYPNCDFWSSPEDFTYFPSGNKCICGTANTAIVGYQRLGDDSLAIFKGESRYEPTLYIRTGTPSSVNDDSSITEGYYVTSGKYITQGAIARQAIAMLNGDALFLSRLGVYGVSINSDSIAVEQRVAKERSRYINEVIRKHANLQLATAIVFDNRYYLAIDDAVYIADARYTFTEAGDMADTFNYEWWVWSDCPVRQFYQLNNELYFGTDDGRLCVFDGVYSDRQYEKLETVSYDVQNNRIYTDKKVSLETGDLAYFKGEIYRTLFKPADMTISSLGIVVSEANLNHILVGNVVYADNTDGTGLETGVGYVVNDIDYASCSFTLTDIDGNPVTPTKSTFTLLLSFEDEIVRIEVDEDADHVEYFSVFNLYTDEKYLLASYARQSISAAAYKYIKRNVVSEWFTPVMDMGANDYVKKLLGITIATEQITNGNISFGWETKSINGLVNIDAKGLDVFDFSNLNFDRFAFDTGFSTSYSKRVKADFNFIIFRFVSDNEYDSCIYSFTVEYKLNRKNKGV